MKFLLAPNLELAKTVNPDVSIEAEYGRNTVFGSVYTAAHHGDLSNNPAPCVDPELKNIGHLLNDETVVLLSHIDLDTVLGCGLLISHKATIDKNFNLLAAWKDVLGVHKIKQFPKYTEELHDMLNGYHAWAEKNRKKLPKDEIVDVTSDILESLNVIENIVTNNGLELIEEGRKWQKDIDELDELSLVGQKGRILIRVSDKFVNSFYKEDGDINLVFSLRNKTITLSTAEEIEGFSCEEFMKSVFGKNAGGRKNIAGTPRGVKFNIFDFEKTINKLVKVFQ